MKKNNKVLVTLFSVVMGLIVGAVILLIAGYNPIEAYTVMLSGIFSRPKYIAFAIIRSTPIILTGVAVTFAFKTGLFNIGVEGQFIVGALFAAIAGYFLNLPPVLHAIVALIIGALAGAVWAGFVGFLKAKSGVNEVISSIMLNWIALYLTNFALTFDSFRRPNSDASYKIQESASIRILGKWKASEAGKSFLSGNEFLKDLLNPPLNYGVFLAIIVAIAIWYILKNTTLGYQLKAVGYNKEAAEFAGININKNIIVSMAISGAIAGLAGATQVLGVTHQVGILAATEGYGFDGIAVSLIAGNNPIGAIPAGLLFGSLQYGGAKLNRIGAPSEIINIVIGVIVFFVAIPKLFGLVSNFLRRNKRGEKVD